MDLSKVILTHHKLTSKGRIKVPPVDGDEDETKLPPLKETGSGQVRDQEKVRLDELIERVKDLFNGDLSDNDKLVYVNNVIKGKLLESETLTRQAKYNTKEQFTNSPDLSNELETAIMDAGTAHSLMSKQALDNEKVRKSLLEALLGPGRLWEMLREREEMAR